MRLANLAVEPAHGPDEHRRPGHVSADLDLAHRACSRGVHVHLRRVSTGFTNFLTTVRSSRFKMFSANTPPVVDQLVGDRRDSGPTPRASFGSVATCVAQLSVIRLRLVPARRTEQIEAARHLPHDPPAEPVVGPGLAPLIWRRVHGLRLPRQLCEQAERRRQVGVGRRLRDATSRQISVSLFPAPW